MIFIFDYPNVFLFRHDNDIRVVRLKWLPLDDFFPVY
jgi:hypothetical protein